MKFHTTLRVPKKDVTIGTADEITEIIRGLGYPGDGWKRDGEHLKWECEFEDTTLEGIASRYNEVRDEITGMVGYYNGQWTADPDDPVEIATRTARDVLEWEQHFDGIELPDGLREALERVAGEEWKP